MNGAAPPHITQTPTTHPCPCKQTGLPQEEETPQPVRMKTKCCRRHQIGGWGVGAVGAGGSELLGLGGSELLGLGGSELLVLGGQSCFSWGVGGQNPALLC